MKWVIAFALLFSIPTTEIAAQEVNAAALTSASSAGAAFPAPQHQPRPQTIRDDDVRDTSVATCGPGNDLLDFPCCKRGLLCFLSLTIGSPM